MSKVAAALRRAREVIADPEDADGLSVDEGSPKAVRRCALGALSIACHEVIRGDDTEVHDQASDVLEAVGEAMLDEHFGADRVPATEDGPFGGGSVNDLMGHAAVLVMFDRAIAVAKDAT